ncbi:DUF5719 family protein [Mycetocola spongiae]|uniref:DUF5719 family protein n=1 Tax=Mycetocola spongiae TaxID=2859226 RepID=UPI001CF20F50|nr:DUF5719 family protein [Mycetocola spongiae]UCR90322.1 hypothetical protein KXZ72_06650 [Mycetocola spongiae]
MPSSKSVAVISGRILAGVAGVGIAGLLALTLGRVDLPEVRAQAPSVEINPLAADQSRVCAGPLLQPASVGGSAAAFGTPAVAVTGDTDPALTALTTPDNSTPEFGAPGAYSLPATGSTVPLLAAAQSQAAGLPDLSGFAASACAEPGADGWLVAGSTAVGRTSLVLLSNPGKADATVTLDIIGEAGAVDAPGAGGIIVRAGEQKVVSLASLAPNVEKPIVHVQTAGGHVFASLQHSSVRGLTPSGVEVAGFSAPPALEQNIVGVTIPGEPAPLESDDHYDDRATALRLLVPGTEPANLTISFVNEGEGDTPLPLTAEGVEPGIVHEIFLANLPGGSFDVKITSDQPTVSSVRVTDTSGADFAWFPSSLPVGPTARLAVAEGANPVLHLANLGTSNTDVRLESEGRDTVIVSVPAGGAATTAVAPGAGYHLSGTADIAASVSYTGEGIFSAFAVQPANPGASTVTVYPR